MAHSKLTSKFQATIPQEIRLALNLEAGDRIIFAITDDNQVVIKKATPLDLVYLEALDSTLSEWSSANDEEDFRDL
ncbi:AbrB/MazE/SpoVT family DNA-binding domain-containing protein [Candidatus Dependentiae bacterium]|nr:AbrB/MazE/SpoVT family DNA-binding domain-containing protein [Candidatus Dependentiae bacterium]